MSAIGGWGNKSGGRRLGSRNKSLAAWEGVGTKRWWSCVRRRLDGRAGRRLGVGWARLYILYFQIVIEFRLTRVLHW